MEDHLNGPPISSRSKPAARQPEFAGPGSLQDVEEALEEGCSIPATPEQSSIWLFDAIRGSSATYNISVAYRFHERLDPDRLDDAFQVLLSRHPILSTRFLTEDGRLVQKACNGDPPRLRHWTANGHLDADTDYCSLDREIREYFDLAANDGLVRLALLGQDVHDIVCLTVHHIVSDERSVDVLLRDLAKAYRGELVVAPPVPQGQPGQSAASSASERSSRASSTLSDALSGTGYQIFASASNASLARAPAMKRRHVFDPTLFTALTGLAHQLNAPLHLVVLTALAHALSEVSACRDFAILTPVTQRATSEEWDEVGLKLKFLPLRCVIDNQDLFHATLEDLRERLFDLIDHGADFSWHQIDNAIVQRRSLALGSALEVMYTAIEDQMSVLEMDGLRGERLYLDNGTAKTAFTCMIGKSGGTFVATFQWKPDSVTESQAQHIWVRISQRIAEEWRACRHKT